MPSLKEARVARLLTMRELAEKAQVSLATVYGVEAGRTTPTLRVIRSLGAALEVDPADIHELATAIDTHRNSKPPRAPRAPRPPRPEV
jgi:transcriptional regulator with XRE-family HTH domain